MNHFQMNINGKNLSWLTEKTPLGLAVMQCLILHRDTPVQGEYITNLFWDKKTSENPSGAFRALISRLRIILKEIDPDLSKCIITYGNCYQWKSPPNTIVDLYAIQDIMDELEDTAIASSKFSRLMKQLFSYYTGKLLNDSPYNKLFSEINKSLQNQYKALLMKYIHGLLDSERYSEIIEVYKKSSCIFPFDNELNKGMQKALSMINKLQTTKQQFKYIEQLNYNYLHINPNSQLQTLYDCSSVYKDTLIQQFNQVQNELISFSADGAFCCDFCVFKEMYDLLIMNLSRLQIPLCLGIIMFDTESNRTSFEQFQQKGTAFRELMQHNLRKGDIMCQCSPSLFAVLLPSADNKYGNLVMERIQRAYYLLHPEAALTLSFRVVSLNSP